MSFGVLIVGLGQIGMGYDLDLDEAGYVYSHARAFSQHPEFRLLGGVDPDPLRCQTFEQAFGCPAYGSLGNALCRCQPDVVAIAVPTHLHRETLMAVLEKSHPKSVLCEKPLSYDLDDARLMLQACAEKDVALYVNYMRRADMGVIEVKRRLLAGDIKAPVKGVAWYSKGFLHNGSHFFNLLEYWLGPMQNSAVLKRGRLWDGTDPEPDVQVTFELGTVVFLAAWEEEFSHYTVELLSSSGRLRYDQGGKLIHWQPAQPAPQIKGYNVLAARPEVVGTGMDRSQWHVTDQLAKALHGTEAHLCTGEEALATLVAMKKILEWT